MERWGGRVAFVTGASGGIGSAICRALLKHGMKVVGCDISEDSLQKVAEEDDVKNSSGEFVPVKCDLSKESDILSKFDEIRKTHGRLDVCVNNAGLSHDSPLLSGKTSDWQDMLNVNVLALSICSREAVKLMREKEIDDGQIIHITGMSGHQLLNMNLPGIYFYCGTKFMVRALTEGLRRELKETDTHIRISSVSPDMVKTDFMDQYHKDDPAKSGAEYFKSLKCLRPQDVADGIIHILSAPPHVEILDILMRPTEQKKSIESDRTRWRSINRCSRQVCLN